MPQQKPNWRFEQVAGTPLTMHGRQITPIARVLHLEWRGARITWGRPLAVEVRDETATYRLAIPDRTGRVLASLALVAGILAILVALWSRIRTA